MMRRILGLGAVAAALCVASSAFAAPGLNLSWSTCHGEGTGTSDRTFACSANTGSNQMVVSFEMPHDLPQISGNEVVIDVLTQQPTLPAWWDIKSPISGPAACRPSSLLFNTTADPSMATCVDWAAGASVGGIGAYDQSGIIGVGGGGSIDPSLTASHRRMKVVFAVPANALVDVFAGIEYFACNINVNNAKTVGAGNCAGCTEPMCIVLNSVNVTTNVLANNVFIGNASTPGSNIITWQGTGPTCSAVPTKNRTWGEVKALYR